MLLFWYKIVTEKNWIIEYSSINLNAWKVVVKAALPSLNKVITHEISCTLLVKGAAIEASASDKLIPLSAYLRAIQSLAPSPHMPTIVCIVSWSLSTSYAFPSGDILAYTCALINTFIRIDSYSWILSIKKERVWPFSATPIESLSFSSSHGTCVVGSWYVLTDYYYSFIPLFLRKFKFWSVLFSFISSSRVSARFQTRVLSSISP